MSVKSKIQALISAANSTTGESDADMTSAVQSLIDGYGGTTITDGIIVKSRDTNGYATEVDYYGDTVHRLAFGCGNTNSTSTSDFPYKNLAKINFKNTVTSLETFCLACCVNLTDVTGLDLSNVVNWGGEVFKFSSNWHFDLITDMTGSPPVTTSGITSLVANNVTALANSACYRCKSLKTVQLPKIYQIGNYTSRCFYECTALETAQFGSVGYGVTTWGVNNFSGCTQSGLTITVYTLGTKVDNLLAEIRNGATNATIVIKASEATTYGGQSYAAGATIITSNP